MNDRPLSIIPSAILSLCFLTALVMPLAENILHFGPHIELPENRKPQEYPAFKWTKKALLSYPSLFEAAFNDRFGLRGMLIRWQALAKFYWLHMSPSERVVLGRDGWFYLADSLPEYRGITALPQGKIKEWRTECLSKKAFLAARGIQYLIVIAPNKETVYPEFLPNNIHQLRKKLYVDDLMSSLPANFRLNILDLRKPLARAKNMDRLYFRTDSHWNLLGAAIASDAIITRLSSWFPELQSSMKKQKAFKTITGPSGGLAQMMGIGDQLREEVFVVPSPAQSLRPAALRSKATMKRILSNQAVESTDGKNYRNAVVTGDSFAEALNIFLPAHFRRTLKLQPYVPYQEPFFQTIVETEKPDVYIEVLVDRHLFNTSLTPSSPAETPSD